MVKFINRDFGTVMYVHESRVEEYKAAGHKPAVSAPSKPAAKPVQPEKPKQPKSRRSSRKKDETEEW